MHTIFFKIKTVFLAVRITVFKNIRITNNLKLFIYSPNQLFFKCLDMHTLPYVISTFITEVLHLIVQLLVMTVTAN